MFQSKKVTIDVKKSLACALQAQWSRDVRAARTLVLEGGDAGYTSVVLA